MRQSITFVDGHSVRDTITRIEDDASGTTRCVQRQDSLDGDVHGRGVEGLEHDLAIKTSITDCDRQANG